MLALLAVISVMLLAQDFYDATQVNEIRLYFTQTNWDQLLDQLFSAGQEGRLLGNAVINGVAYDSVGVRYKGNSSYNANQVKNPFNIKLDYVRQDQLIDGKYGTIKLSNGMSDPTLVREVLSYEIARKYMPAGKANYAVLYVNDAQIGAYTCVQDVDSYFMDTYFHVSGKPRFKCDTNTFNPIVIWGYLGADSTAYDQYYGLESDYGWAQLMNFTNVMSSNPTNLPNVLNIDQNLWMIAFDNLLVNLDSPIQIFHNFYLFGDYSNRMNPLLWDLNMSFGGFAQGMTITTMQNMDPLRNQSSSQFLLISRMMSNARYKKMYLAHMRTMLTENFTNNWYYTRAQELQAICGPYVQADTHFFYSYTNFQANLNTQVTGGGGPGGQSIPGLTQLMNARATYLQSNAAFSGTVPIITAIDHSAETVMLNSTLDFTMTVSNATYAQLGYRQNHADKFNYLQMYDDGQHNDGAAGDGVYGVSIEVTDSGDIEYYGWAENASQGAFFPARAEFEFLTVPVYTEPGELVINEIMAKNMSYADPFGEFDDWVELYNPQDYAINIAGMYITDSHYANGVSTWTQIPSTSPILTTIQPHDYLLVWFDGDLDQGPLHINYQLGAAADAVYLIDSDATTIIDSYMWNDTTGLNADDVSIGRLPDGGTAWQLFGVGQASPSTPGSSNQGVVNSAPVITNISYSPMPVTASAPVTISATVTDADNNLDSVQLLWGVSSVSEHTTNMTQQQGSIYSCSIGPLADGTAIIYSVKASDIPGAVTYSPTYNILVGYTIPALCINEIMPSNTLTITDNYGDYEDWVELYNPNDYAVDLAGFYLTDSHYIPDTDLSADRISYAQPDSTIIPGHHFKVFWFDEEPTEGVLHVNRKLGADVDGVYLVAPDMLTVVDQFSWNAELGFAADLSYGRYPDGSPIWEMFGSSLPVQPTPGSNNAPLANADESGTPSIPVLSFYPNPMQAQLHIEVSNLKSPSKVYIYNLKGSLVRELTCLPGSKAVWDGCDKQGKQSASGIYILKAKAGVKNLTDKICLMH
jgi:spore coat protein CotH